MNVVPNRTTRLLMPRLQISNIVKFLTMTSAHRKRNIYHGAKALIGWRSYRPVLFVIGLICGAFGSACVLDCGAGRCFAQAPRLAQAPGPQQVIAVEILGNRTVDKNTVLGLIETRSGRAFDRDLIESDVRALNRSGKFVTVSPRRKLMQGGVVVIFEVVERPTLQYVKFLGNQRYRDQDLAKEIDLNKGDPLSPYEVEEGRRKLQEFYQEKGFNNTQVSVIEGNQPTDQGAVFLVNEGLIQKVRWTHFLGNTVVSSARLKTQIQSKHGFGWLIGGQFDRKKVDEDIIRLTAYYRSLGYFRAKISRELELTESRRWVTITFFIDEGPRYQVRNVSFEGNSKLDTLTLSQDLKIVDGSKFDQSKLNRDVAKIQDAYGIRGHIFAKVKADPRFLVESGKLDLVYQIEEGDRYRIGEIKVQIEGENAHTRRNVVLNRIPLRPGDIADIRKLRASRVRLQRSGLFENDPARGITPELKFQRRSDEQIARQNGNGPRVRGQSPEPLREIYIFDEWHNGAWHRIARPANTPRESMIQKRRQMLPNGNTLPQTRRYP